MERHKETDMETNNITDNEPRPEESRQAKRDHAPERPPICEDIIRREDTPNGETFATITAGTSRWYADVETGSDSVTVTARIAGKCFVQAVVRDGFEHGFARKHPRLTESERVAARGAFLRVARAFHSNPDVRGLLNA